MRIQDIIQGQAYGGSILGRGSNATFAQYIPPNGCPYIGIYNYDSRCRSWVIQPSQQNQITPIEPNIILSGNNPFQATQFCKSQRQYEDVSGNMIKTNCTHSVNCLVFELSSIKNYFDQNSFYKSTTFMIDPRSQILVYNQLQNNTQYTTHLANSAEERFPNDTEIQKSFIQGISKNLQRNKNFFASKERLIIDEKNQCQFDPFKVEELLHMQPINFGNYAFVVPKIQLKNNANSLSKSFILKSGSNDEVFVTLNYIYIIEKLQDNYQNKQFEIQDLFILIDILPKKVLTSQTDLLKENIQKYLLWVSIGSLILCLFLIIMAAVISYQVAVMIEKPLIHMTNVLNILNKEGCGAAIDLIESETSDIDSIFLSKDSKILFDSFKKIIKMLQLATEDIFTVEDSCSLIRLNYQINFFKEFNNKRVLGICYNNMGNIHFQNGRYFESMEAYQYAIILAQQEAGFYSEYGNDENILSQEYQINKETREYKNEEQGNMSTSQNVDKRISEQVSIDQQFNNQRQHSKENFQEYEIYKSKYQNVKSGLKEIIFNRKFNYSHAFYMHNISQDTDQQVILGNINNKILNNPLNCKKSTQTRSAKTMFEWENYEEILLDLIQLNSELKINSFGRNVILLTQLSLCHLKMGKIEQAIYEQSIAIDYYYHSVKLQSLRNKSKSQLTLKSEYEQQNLQENRTSKRINKQKQIPDTFEIIPTYISASNQQRVLISCRENFQMKEEIAKFKEGQGNIEDIDNFDDDLSLISLIRKRQSTTKKKMEQRKKSNFLQAGTLFQVEKKNMIVLERPQLSQENEIDKDKKIEEQNINFQGIRNQSIASCRSNYLKETRFSEASNRIDEPNLSPIKNRLVQKGFVQSFPKKIKKNNLLSRNSSQSDPLENFHKQKIHKIQVKNKEQSLTSTFLNLQKNLSSLSDFENIETKQNKVGKQIYDQVSQGSVLMNLRSRKDITSEGKMLTENNKILFSTQFPQLHKKSARKIKNHHKNSKVNKHLMQEDLKQIQRYELPSDILLYYITLQESRLLILENNQLHSAFILTDLLEKTKFYLPYFRLACLDVLSNITQSNEQIQSQINKLKQRFDADIQFNASIAVVVSQDKQDAFKTIITLVNEVFIKDEDILSLLLYEQNSFKQIIPSISLKQLRLTGGYFEQLLESASQKNNLQRQFPIQEVNAIHPCLSNSFLPQNSKVHLIENKGTIQRRYHQELLTPKKRDSENSLKKNQIIQIIPSLMSRIALSELSLNRDEKDNLLIQISPQQLKKTSQYSQISPLTVQNNFSHLKEEINQFSSLMFEVVDDQKQQLNNARILEISGQQLMKNNLKDEQLKAQITEDQLLNPSSSSQIFDSYSLKNTSYTKIQNNNQVIPFSTQRKHLPQKLTQNLKNIPSLIEIENNNKEIQNTPTFNMNLIFHLAARQCIKNFFNQDQNKYEIHQKSIQEGIHSNQKKFMIFITDILEIMINQAYQMLSNLLYSTQTQLLILLLNEETYLEEDYAFKDVQINDKIVIKYFYTHDNLIQYIRNKREVMKSFGIPVLVEHLNM